MQTINIPAESLRIGDEIVLRIGSRDLAWPVQSAVVRGRNVEAAIGHGTFQRYARNERVTVRRPA